VRAGTTARSASQDDLGTRREIEGDLARRADIVDR
jgi:hypothetical protein